MPDARYRLRVIAYMSLLITVAVLVISSLLYMIFERTTLKLIQDSNQAILEQTDININNQISYAKKLSTNIYFDPAVYPLLHGSIHDELELLNAKKQVASYKAIYQDILSIYIFNKDTGFIYTTPDTAYYPEIFYDKAAAEMFVSNLSKNDLFFYARMIPSRFEESQPGYTYYMHDLSATIFKDHSAVAVNFNAKWMSSYLAEFELNPDINTLAVSDEGIVFAVNSQQLLLTSLSGEKYLQKIFDMENNRGYIVEKIDDVKSFISYYRSGENNWHLLRIIPYKQIFGVIQTMRTLVIFLALSVMTCCMVVIFFLTKKLTQPITEITERLAMLEQQRNNNESQRRRQYFQLLLLNSSLLTGDSSNEIFWETDHEYLMILIMLDHYRDELILLDPDKLQELQQNIITLMGRQFNDFNEEQLILSCYDADRIVLTIGWEFHSRFIEDDNIPLKAFQQTVLEKTGHTVSLIVSDSGIQPSEFKTMIGRLQEVGNERFVLGYNCIVRLNSEGIRYESSYNEQQEQEIIDPLLKGNFENARTVFDKHMLEQQQQGYAAAYTFLIRIALALERATEQSGAWLRENRLEINKIIENLKTCEVLPQAIDMFHHFMQIVCEKAGRIKRPELSDYVLQLIEEHYSQQYLGISWLAEKLGVTASYLGKVFKLETGQGATDYIQAYRIHHAKKMLETETCDITHIAERCGFSSANYFGIIFKKSTGLTPKEYRRQHMQ
ncbi:hypothetical protein AGMMS49546_37260 [Spirochaetia bacterium]|nr:hypothetical protein AGMMS49546_37260 [Spirochaetia bacterium]